MEKSQNNKTNANEQKQMNHSNNTIPAGVENLEQNIHDATSRYDDLEFPNRSDEAKVD